MKSDDFTEIPSIPMVVQGVVLCCWTHFVNTWGQWIRTCPNGLDILTDCPRGPLHITEVEIVPTRLAMTIDMPSRDCHVNPSCLWNLHFGWNSSIHFRKFLDHWQAMLYVRTMRRSTTPMRAAKTMKSTLQYLSSIWSVRRKSEIVTTYFSPS